MQTKGAWIDLETFSTAIGNLFADLIAYNNNLLRNEVEDEQ